MHNELLVDFVAAMLAHAKVLCHTEFIITGVLYRRFLFWNWFSFDACLR